MEKPKARVSVVRTPLRSAEQRPRTHKPAPTGADAAFLRAPGEDDDGYDPYSDRPATPERLFEEDPWR